MHQQAEISMNILHNSFICKCGVFVFCSNPSLRPPTPSLLRTDVFARDLWNAMHLLLASLSNCPWIPAPAGRGWKRMAFPKLASGWAASTQNDTVQRLAATLGRMGPSHPGPHMQGLLCDATSFPCTCTSRPPIVQSGAIQRATNHEHVHA